MTKNEILSEIEKEAFIWVNRFTDSEYLALEELEGEKKVESLFQANGSNENFMNDSYVYVLKGNPRKVCWYEEHKGQWGLKYDS